MNFKKQQEKLLYSMWEETAFSKDGQRCFLPFHQPLTDASQRCRLTNRLRYDMI